MANTLTGLYPVMYQGLDVVSRENTGAINAVNKNADAAQASVGQTVSTPIVPVTTASDITPAMVPANSGGQTIGKVDMLITKSRKTEVLWNGEEVNATAQYEKIMQDQFAQAFRALSNEVEEDIIAAAVADGTGGDLDPAGTNPFLAATGMKDFAAIDKLFRDAGADGQVRQVVMTSQHLANVKGELSNLFKANEAGSDALLRDGIIARVQGLNLYDSAGFDTVVDSLAFTPNAIQLLARTPYSGNDQAMDRTYVTDPKTGLVFEVSLYAGYRQMKIEIGLAWGVKVIKPEHVFNILNVAV